MLINMLALSCVAGRLNGTLKRWRARNNHNKFPVGGPQVKKSIINFNSVKRLEKWRTGNGENLRAWRFESSHYVTIKHQQAHIYF